MTNYNPSTVQKLDAAVCVVAAPVLKTYAGWSTQTGAVVRSKMASGSVNYRPVSRLQTNLSANASYSLWQSNAGPAKVYDVQTGLNWAHRADGRHSSVNESAYVMFSSPDVGKNA